jgi:hypothetical protein
VPAIQGHWTRISDVATRTVDGETLLVPIRRDPNQRVSVLTLNESGSLLWEALGRPSSAEELAARLSHEFDVGIEAARADVLTFLSELRAAGLIAAA